MDASVVVFAGAVREDNPEILGVQFAQQDGVHRSMALICYTNCQPGSWNRGRLGHATSRRKVSSRATTP